MEVGSRSFKTPLPNPQFFILLCIRLCEPIAFTLLFPFVYFMVKDFNITDDTRMIGYYAGLVSASFAVGEFLSGVPWGMLSDRVGRKPVMMLGLLGTTVTMFMFGLSKSLPWAMATRLMAGILNGNIGVLKSTVGEMTDRTNRALAFSYVSMVFGLGLTVGPALGGFLTHPAENFPALFGGVQFLREYPYFLPCAVSSSMCAASLVAAHFFLEETLNRTFISPPETSCEATTPLLGSEASAQTSPTYGTFSTRDEPTLECPERGAAQPAPSNAAAISRGTWLVILVYMGLSLIVVMGDELLPFWAATEISHGGLGYDASDIGILNSMMGVILISFQLGLYAPLQRRFTTLNLLRWAFLLFIPLFAVMPFVSNFLAAGRPRAAWGSLILLFALRTFCNMLGFTSYNILLPESCAFKRILGKTNGVSQALSSLMRGVGPYLCGVVWSWSLTNQLPFPFDYHFTFFAIGAISLVTHLIALNIRPEMVAF